MARPVRIEFAGGLHHVMLRGNLSPRQWSATTPTVTGDETGSNAPWKRIAGGARQVAVALSPFRVGFPRQTGLIPLRGLGKLTDRPKTAANTA